MKKLTSSNRDPTLAVTSRIPELCAPAIILPRRCVGYSYSGLRGFKSKNNKQEEMENVWNWLKHRESATEAGVEAAWLGHIFFRGQSTVTRSCRAVRRRFACCSLALLFHARGHRKSFRFNPRRVTEGSASFQRRVPPQVVCYVKVSLPQQDRLPGPLLSPFGEDRLESFAALTSSC